MVRSAATILGLFCAFNIAGEFVSTGFDANCWWIDLRPLSGAASRIFLALASAALIAFALAPTNARLRQAAIVSLVALCAVTLYNVVRFYALVGTGRINAFVPLPLSLVFLCVFLPILSVMIRSTRLEAFSPWAAAGLFVAALICFPLAQMLFFGTTDYRRKADAAVVFGARTYADGSPSTALADRVRTACELYNEGYVDTLIFSGGPGDGAVHETEAMSTLALHLGVPRAAMLFDRAGLNTQATVRNTKALFAEHGIRRVLAVSHFYHLPRIKLAYQRAGFDVCTVPTKQSYILARMPLLMAREVAALWKYFLVA